MPKPGQRTAAQRDQQMIILKLDQIIQLLTIINTNLVSNFGGTLAAVPKANAGSPTVGDRG
jgi:hypothetical protein